ncbi:hypothetical protein ARD30_19165 [Bosea thiooxidans]|uniref:VWFA domain-containing protein n=1 Tax=Bosea thiooxidans TaxID=53254 RepID=A0A0Q3I2R2_9HYPH|nr:pilus assembly protein [Bosea thiooxidans]KQK29168.1 hypothetical protein ARD30_19165 [Bosea thiooxidans]
MGKIGFLQEMMRRFRRDQRGNVALLFGLTLVPMMGVVGVAVDYSRASNARQALSSAIDAAALMAARDAQKLSDADVKTRVAGWIKDNLPPDVKEGLVEPTITIDRTARTVQISAKVDMPTTIAKIIGTNHILVASNSRSTWGTNTIELALVLDNTGSMKDDGKMDALKLASNDLINVMEKAKDLSIADQIRISIVPFSTRIVLDTGLVSSSWLRWGMKLLDCSNYSPYTCRETSTRISKQNWEGCVADRDDPNDVTDSDSSINPYPADFCDDFSPRGQASILPLTGDWQALRAKVASMKPIGATNVTIGAVWGMATLSPSEPFTQAKPASTPRLKKYMILLTDGQNTRSRFAGNGRTWNSNIDLRTAKACENAKAAGITVYTIRVMDGNTTMLRNCATSKDMYYEVDNASQLGPVFKAIAAEISQVRLTL